MLELHRSEDVRRHVLLASRTLAVVGLSDDARKPSYWVSEYMQRASYEIIPVNPNRAGKLIHGQLVFPSLAEIPTPVDIVNVFRPAQVTPAIAEQAVAIGAKVLWLQLGIENLEAARIASEGGLTVVMNRCIKTEHRRLLG